MIFKSGEKKLSFVGLGWGWRSRKDSFKVSWNDYYEGKKGTVTSETGYLCQ